MGKSDSSPERRKPRPKTPSKPRSKEQLEQELGDSRYPAADWPVDTVAGQVELLVRIAADVAAKRISARDGYNERLRLGWRVFLYEMK